jgi:hypothetical protein
VYGKVGQTVAMNAGLLQQQQQQHQQQQQQQQNMLLQAQQQRAIPEPSTGSTSSYLRNIQL